MIILLLAPDLWLAIRVLYWRETYRATVGGAAGLGPRRRTLRGTTARAGGLGGNVRLDEAEGRRTHGDGVPVGLPGGRAVGRRVARHCEVGLEVEVGRNDCVVELMSSVTECMCLFV